MIRHDTIGRTLVRNYETVLKNCRKMSSIVNDNRSPYKNLHCGFPSGRQFENFQSWCVLAFWKDSKGLDPYDDNVNEDSPVMPRDYIFNGYVTWCLMGPVTFIDDNVDRRSSSFHNCKEDGTSKSLSRSELKRSATADLLMSAGKKKKSTALPMTGDAATVGASILEVMKSAITLMSNHQEHRDLLLTIEQIKQELADLRFELSYCRSERARLLEKGDDAKAMELKIEEVTFEISKLTFDLKTCYSSKKTKSPATPSQNDFVVDTTNRKGIPVTVSFHDNTKSAVSAVTEETHDAAEEESFDILSAVQ